MSRIRLNIDGLEVCGRQGQTILDIARENGIEIPTLCHDERVEAYASCGICTVEAEGSPKLLRSCSTLAADGMIVKTNTDRVRRNRKTALELMLSNHAGDCRAPCAIACPAQTDCQGYVGLVANGEHKEALRLIKESIPLPACIGRVCPHPCETACRRELVEEPIAIAAIKQFAGDLDLDNPYVPETEPPSGKSAAIIGGGPGGLSAAYFLRKMGHAVSIFDAMPQMGGMLRYGIPEYRLPKKILDAEIAAIERMGASMRNGIRVGADITLDHIRKNHDAVVVAIGAWKSAPLGCPGEELEGVFGGIDFLRDVALNRPVFTGRRVAVVGGGNTAMDACRTSVRLGAQQVFNIYRRTRNEMPAEEIEIVEAEEEGVIFRNLTNPIEVVGENGRVKAVRLQIMELGEPDASGRRAPVAIPGKEETIEVDAVIVAIGQKTAPAGLEDISQTKWGTLAADQATYLTNLDGVFAIGDATNNGADIAIKAIGEAKFASDMIDRYLRGEELVRETPYLAKTEKTQEDFDGTAKAARAKISHRSPAERRGDFLAVNHALSEDSMRKEAMRCLECGCLDYFECRLIEYANQYSVKPEKYGQKKASAVAKSEGHPHLKFDADKCVLCGLCVRICNEAVGASALGLVERGINTTVRPALLAPLSETDCISCGQCTSVCPTGAIADAMAIAKQVPLKESAVQAVCPSCSVGCKTQLMTYGNMLTRILPANENSLLCANGRFGFGGTVGKERISAPMINGEKAELGQAIVFANKKLQSLQTQHGQDCIAVAISGRHTNEEASLIVEYAQKALKTPHVFSFGRTCGGLEDVPGFGGSTATLDEMENAELIVAVSPASLVKNHAVAAMRIRRAVNGGAKLLLVHDGESLLDDAAALIVDGGEGMGMLLREIEKALKDDCKGDSEAEKAAAMIAKARKAVFAFEKAALSTEAIGLIASVATLSGHDGRESPRNGMLQLLPEANSQGLADLGVKPREECVQAIADGKIRGLFIFGEDPTDAGLDSLDFLAVQALHMTDAAAKAHVVFPASSFAESGGSYTSADGRTQKFPKAVDGLPLFPDNAGLARKLALQAGWESPQQ